MPYLPVHGVEHYYEWITKSSPSIVSASLTANPSTANPKLSHSPQKPVMVFLHGWGGSARYWHKVAQQLTGQFDCLLYDLRGFGRSRLPNPIPAGQDYRLEAYAQDLLSLLDQMNLDRVHMNSHSMGASIAALFTNRYPHRIERLILTCNGLLEYEQQAFEAFHRFSYAVVKFRPRWFLQVPLLDRLFMARFLHGSIPERDRREFLEDFILADFDAALGTALTAVSKESADAMPQEYRQLPVSTLLISGEYDQIISADMGKQAAALNPKVQHKVVANTGHFPMLEDSTTYMQYLQDFLQDT